MKRLAALALVLLTGAADAPQIETLAWMAGQWSEQKGARWTEESWTSPRGGMLLGTGRSGQGNVAASFEFMRIAPGDGGVLTFFGSPGGAATVAFPLVERGKRSVTFANPAHNYPTRISYRRTGDVLMAETSGSRGAPVMRWRYTRR